MEMFYVYTTQYGSHMCLLSTWKVARETEEYIFNFNVS